ncbi:p21-activated protein kinase-interacting protein 1-like protein [Bulinus truncatus]|nr:p21-activated protein kinase-interacting protein 1-like protein [Bulinus truncatus]
MENIEIIVGTYENLILGYKIIKQLKGDYNIEVSFTDDSHRGALRCMSVSPNGTLVSSSTDDSVRLHNLTKRKDIGGLFEHTGTVNSINFFGSNHMFTASEDGTICIWKFRTWEILRTLKGHKAHVMAMTVHPSGKLGLSVGRDKSFLTWDLTTGKLAFQRRLKEMAQSVLFTPNGDHYILVYQKTFEVCSLEDTDTVKVIPTDWRINSAHFIQEDLIAVGGDSQHVLIVNVLSGETVLTLNCIKPDESNFTSRVRCMCTTKLDDATLIIIGMANGNIAVYKISNVEEQTVSELILFHETKVRLTCIAVHNKNDIKAKESVTQVKRKLRKVKKSEDSTEESDQEKTESSTELKPKRLKTQEEVTKTKTNEIVVQHGTIENKTQIKKKERKQTPKKKKEMSKKNP